MVTRRRWPLIVSLTTFLAAMACATVTRFNPLNGGGPLGPAPTATAAAAVPAAPAAADSQLAVLDAIDQAVRDQYLDPQLGGVDWAGAVAAARAQVAAGLSEADFAAAMQTLVDTLPAGTAAYVTRAERLEQETQSANAYQGIGVYYGFRETPEPRVIVLSVIPNSPAEAAGLHAHDAIYAIDGQPIQAAERDTIANRIRGPAGSAVTLTLQTPGEARRDLLLQRGTITATDSLRGGSDPASGISFYRVPVAAGADLAQTIAGDLVQTSQTSPVKGIILDLRLASSSGGWPLQEMLTLFGNGTLGEFYDRSRTEPLTVTGADQGNSQTAALVILIGPDTRGAVEVLAGGLQATGRAKLIGLPSAGETNGFSPVDLPDGSRLTLLTSSFRLPDGTDLGKQGLTPDIRVDADWDTFANNADDPVLDAALKSLAQP